MHSKDVNMDQGKVIFEDTNNGFDNNSSENPHVTKIAGAALNGNWVLIVPIIFPQYMNRVYEKLDEMRQNDEIH